MPAVDSLKVAVIGARTDSAGVAQTDFDQEELRLMLAAAGRGPGVLPFNLNDRTTNANAFRVRQGTGSNMFVTVGSGDSKGDGAVLWGTVDGQGAYAVRLDSAGLSVSVPAADASLPRKYGVYLFVNDATYSGTASRAYAGISVVAGTAAASPTVPGPTATWSASLLLWSFQLAAAATAVTNTILDNTNAVDARTTADPLGVNPLAALTFS